ncbi:MAG: hypothetical protein RL291_1494 [Pseudomonadota bacterium]
MSAWGDKSASERALQAPSLLEPRLRLNARRLRARSREALKDLAWQIADREAFFRNLLEAQDDIVWCEANDGTLVYANPAYQRLVGGVDGPPGLPRRRGNAEGAEPCSDTRVTRSLEEYETPSGWRWFEVLRHRDPGTGFVQCVGRDVTERMGYQRQIEEARDAANAANRAKSRFLAAMSHEIRTPMNGVLGMAALLAETPLGAEQRTYLNAMDRSGRTLLALIDEILDFSKIEAGRLDLADQPIVIEDCVQSVIDLLQPRAQAKGIALALAIDPALPPRVIGDDVRFKQILTNLIGNAVKFTDRGGVLVTIEGDRRAAPRSEALKDRLRAKTQTLVISVLDTGIGISADALTRLFAEFEQGDETHVKRHGGTGLGLAITRRLARAMGGDVFARSKPGDGSTFTAVIRLKSAPDSRPLPLPNWPAIGSDVPHVLLVTKPGVELLALRLALQGAGVPAADTTVDSALRVVARAAEEDAPFTALVVDGTVEAEVAGRILAALRQHIAARGIVVLDLQDQRRFKIFEARGFDALIARPHKQRALVDVLASPVTAGGILPAPRIEAAQPASVMPSGGLRVLLVEDNDINLLLAQRMLEKFGCSIATAHNGVAAVSAIDRHIAGLEKFDLVLMDVHMPVMDGLEAARTIRQRFQSLGQLDQCPPIVALTANAFAEDRKRCIDAGMSDFLTKPFEREALQRLLERLGGRKGQAQG